MKAWHAEQLQAERAIVLSLTQTETRWSAPDKSHYDVELVRDDGVCLRFDRDSRFTWVLIGETWWQAVDGKRLRRASADIFNSAQRLKISTIKRLFSDFVKRELAGQ